MQQVLHAYLGADVPEDVKQGNALSDSDQAPVEQTSPIYTLACCKAREVFLICRMSLPASLVYYRLTVTQGLYDAIKMSDIRPHVPPIQNKRKDKEAYSIIFH